MSCAGRLLYRRLPRGWIERMKRAIRTLGWRFNANRMVMDYVNNCYIPAAGGTSSDRGEAGVSGQPHSSPLVSVTRSPSRSASRSAPSASVSA